MSEQHNDPNFDKWAQDWQAGIPKQHGDGSAERIRRYFRQRSGTMRSFMVADFAIGAVALPVLGYFAWIADNDIERASMSGLMAITVATIAFGSWNWRGVLKASATTTSDYVALSAERLRRLRLACRIAWVVMLAQVMVFTIWIWNRLYSGAAPPQAWAERFSWGWLAGFTVVAIVSLVWFGRWIARDARRFEALRRELDS